MIEPIFFDLYDKERKQQMTIRVDNELYALVTACAAHCGLTVSDVARRTSRWAHHYVERLQNRECSTNGGVVMGFRGVELNGVTPSQFRWALWLRCTEALSRRGVNPFVTPLKAGRDYIVVDAE